MDEKWDKFKAGLISSMGFIAVFIIVAIYIARSFVVIGETGKTVAQIIADGIFALLYGWSIKVLLGYQGVLSGQKTKLMQNTTNRHAEMVLKIEKHSPLLESFCDKENAELRIKKRKLILSKQNLHYEDVFCDDPQILLEIKKEREKRIRLENKTIDTRDFKSWKRRIALERKIHKEIRAIDKCVRKANNISISQLSEYMLTTDGANGDDPFKFPLPLTQHLTKKSISMLPSAILFAVVFGYYGYTFIEDPSWATVIGGLIQTATFLGWGAIQFLSEYLYTTDTYRKGIVRKIDILSKFYEEAEHNGGNFVIPEEIIITKQKEIAKGETNGNEQTVIEQVES